VQNRSIIIIAEYFDYMSHYDIVDNYTEIILAHLMYVFNTLLSHRAKGICAKNI
jgi:hypothetical protein